MRLAPLRISPLERFLLAVMERRGFQLVSVTMMVAVAVTHKERSSFTHCRL